MGADDRVHHARHKVVRDAVRSTEHDVARAERHVSHREIGEVRVLPLGWSHGPSRHVHVPLTVVLVGTDRDLCNLLLVRAVHVYGAVSDGHGHETPRVVFSFELAEDRCAERA